MNFRNKNLIFNNKKISNCTSNIAKLTLFEYMYCQLFIWNDLSETIKNSFIEMIKSFVNFIFHILDLILFPFQLIFIFPITSYKALKRERKEYFSK